MDDRRKKLRFRAWRRGFRELDLILGPFADAELEHLNDPALEAFERLLDAPDQEVYAWVTEAADPPPDFNTPTLAQIRTFRYQMATRTS